MVKLCRALYISLILDIMVVCGFGMILNNNELESDIKNVGTHNNYNLIIEERNESEKTILKRLVEEFREFNQFDIDVNLHVGYENPKHEHIVEIQQLACWNNLQCNTTAVGPKHGSACCGDCSCNITSCMSTQSCCPDLLLSTFGDFPSIPEMPQHCIAMEIEGSRFLIQGKYGVDKCPSGTDERVASYCSREYSRQTETFDFSDITPCYDTKQHLIFRNKYCAYCNNINDEDLSYFNLTLTCSKVPEHGFRNNDEILDVIFEENVCTVKFTADLECDIENCRCLTTVASCNETGNWHDYDPDIENACHEYTSVYKQFKNIFCYICNGYNVSDIQSVCSGPVDEIHNGDTKFSFSGLLKITPSVSKNRLSTFAKQVIYTVICFVSVVFCTCILVIVNLV